MELSRRQQEILDLSISLTANGGLHELTIKRLAEGLGVTEPAIYRHFRSKAEIVRMMIAYFEEAFTVESSHLRGWGAIRQFIMNRIELLLRTPALAKVMFTEEYFRTEQDFLTQMRSMMRHHREWIQNRLEEERLAGTIRSDISLDAQFRIIIGSVRLLVKQWAISEMPFDLHQQGSELLDSIELILKP